MKKQSQNPGPNPQLQGRGDDSRHHNARRAAATLTLEALEPRILLSGTWVDADTGAVQSEAESGNDAYSGTSGDDTADGHSGNDILLGLSGTDSLFGGAGDDYLDGGAGNDALHGEDGADLLLGAEGDDSLKGGDGEDSLDGGWGDDVLKGGSGADTLTGGEGHDTLKGGADDDSLNAGAGNDKVEGGQGNDFLLAGEGHDKLSGGSGHDTLDGGIGNDKLQGGKGDDTLSGAEGNDVLKGDGGNDLLMGGAGDDVLKGGKEVDTLLAGEGDDRLDGGSGDDTLDGGAGDDVLQGGTGDDALLGGEGQDTLRGGKGDDTLDGGTGNDTLYGGDGNDVFLASGGQDTLIGNKGGDIFDFSHAQAGDVYTVNGGKDHDTIDLSTYNDGQVTMGDGRIDVMGNNGAFIIHHKNIESIKTGANAPLSLDSPVGDDGLDFDTSVDDEGSDTGDETPFADAGGEQIVQPGGAVTLDATQSEAFESGADLTYAWTQTGGPAVGLTNANSGQASFTAPGVTAPTILTFEVEVSDGLETAKDTVTVTVQPEEAPTVDAGLDLIAEEGAIVQLSGAATDPVGEGLTYQWTQTGGPGVTLSDPTAANPTFAAPEGLSNISLTFELRVSDGANTAVDSVTVHVNAADDAPSADAGADQTVAEGTIVQLSGTATDPEGQGIGYEWVQSSGPSVALSDPSAANPTFVAPRGPGNGSVTFELRASDGTNTSVDTVTIFVQGADSPQESASIPPTPLQPDSASSVAPTVVAGPSAQIAAEAVSHPPNSEAHDASSSKSGPMESGDSSAISVTPQAGHILHPTPIGMGSESTTETGIAIGESPSEVPSEQGQLATATPETDSSIQPHNGSAMSNEQGGTQLGNEDAAWTTADSAAATTPHPIWDGTEDLGILDPHHELHESLEHRVHDGDGARSESGFGLHDAAAPVGYTMVDHFVMPAGGRAQSGFAVDWMPSIGADLRVGDLFETVEERTRDSGESPTVADSVPMAIEQSPQEEERTIVSSMGRVGRAADQGNRGWESVDGPRPTADWQGSAESIDSALPESLSLFARLWSAVRGLGATALRNSETGGPDPSSKRT